MSAPQTAGADTFGHQPTGRRFSVLPEALVAHSTVSPTRKETPMLDELILNASHSTTQGFIGVSLIFAYFCLIVATSFYRIKKGEHMDHHDH